MARIKKGILGGVSGKVGNVVGGFWKGISYIRSLPSHVNDANSIPQKTVRMKMRMVTQLLQTYTAFIRIGFNGYAVKMSAFNAATSYNYHHGVKGEYPDFEPDYPNLLVSRGSLAGGDNVTCSSAEAGKVTFNWLDNSGSGEASPGDTALLLVHNPAKNRSVYLLQGNSRSDSGATVNVPADFSGDEVHCYLGFADLGKVVSSKVKNFVSNSVYAGSVVVA
jgi:hypothetical protein